MMFSLCCQCVIVHTKDCFFGYKRFHLSGVYLCGSLFQVHGESWSLLETRPQHISCLDRVLYAIEEATWTTVGESITVAAL